MAKDSYVQKFGEIIVELEKLYGLEETNELGVRYLELDIDSVMSYENNLVMAASVEDKKRKNSEAGKYVVLIAYMKDRLEFYGKKKLNYSDYPRIDTVAECLLNFVDKETVSSQALNNLNKVIFVLQGVDKRFVQHKFGLGYRFIRLFLIMVLWENYCNASILARFIIDQIFVGEV